MDPNFPMDFPVGPQGYEETFGLPTLYNFMEVPPTPSLDLMLQVEAPPCPQGELNDLQSHLRSVWNMEMREMTYNKTHKRHQFPISRIKRVMKRDPEVKMVTAEAPVLISKACEFLVMELSIRSWLRAGECGRQSIEGCDVGRAICEAKEFEFLKKIAPIYEAQEAGEIAEADQVHKVGTPQEFVDPGFVITEPFQPMEPGKNVDNGGVADERLGRSS